MAGSFRHCVDDDGHLLPPDKVASMLDTPGDVYEAVEQMFGMVVWLAETLGNVMMPHNPKITRELIAEAENKAQRGLALSRSI